MPAEEAEHERTWMCWPSNEDIWGDGLEEVQNNIAEIARAIAAFEPVTMLVRPEEMEAGADLLGEEIELLEAPVDDLWARDTLPAFLITAPGDPQPGMAAGRVRFNGWGGKQTHDGDATLAELLATHLDIPLHDWGLVGEGGGFEVDGAGTVLAAESSWVNDNRNPGKTRDEIEAGLLSLLGADRMIWVDGLAGHDITDGHIDTLARFASETTIVVDAPAFPEEDNVWVDLAARTKELIEAAVTSDGEPYEVIEITQPGEPRGTSDGFLASYMNYYVCNGAVIAPEFGDEAADADVASNDLQRIADVPINFADPMSRRAPALQQTADAVAPTARMNEQTLAQVGVAEKAQVRVRQGAGEAVLVAKTDNNVPNGCVRVSAAHASTAMLGEMFGSISVERA